LSEAEEKDETNKENPLGVTMREAIERKTTTKRKPKDCIFSMKDRKQVRNKAKERIVQTTENKVNDPRGGQTLGPRA